jgi:hypothetical protein
MTAEDGRGAPDVPAKPAIWQRSVALSPPNFRVHGVVRLNSGQAPPAARSPSARPLVAPARRTDVPSAMQPARPCRNIAVIGANGRRRWFAFRETAARVAAITWRNPIGPCRAAGRSG